VLLASVTPVSADAAETLVVPSADVASALTPMLDVVPSKTSAAM
jgi:hypothetical protein